MSFVTLVALLVSAVVQAEVAMLKLAKVARVVRKAQGVLTAEHEEGGKLVVEGEKHAVALRRASRHFVQSITDIIEKPVYKIIDLTHVGD